MPDDPNRLDQLVAACRRAESAFSRLPLAAITQASGVGTWQGPTADHFDQAWVGVLATVVGARADLLAQAAAFERRADELRVQVRRAR